MKQTDDGDSMREAWRIYDQMTVSEALAAMPGTLEAYQNLWSDPTHTIMKRIVAGREIFTAYTPFGGGAIIHTFVFLPQSKDEDEAVSIDTRVESLSPENHRTLVRWPANYHVEPKYEITTHTIDCSGKARVDEQLSEKHLCVLYSVLTRLSIPFAEV